MVESLESWFERSRRALPWREDYTPYEVWIAEVMAQQTRMDVVLRYWEEFIQRFPTVERLAASEEEEVLAAWSGLGYYRRARMLREGAIEVVERYGGEIPSDVKELESIRGIGPYTAGAIASIAYDRPVPVVDGNVLRVLSRVAMLDEPLGTSALQRECRRLASKLVARAASPRNFNQGLMELGAGICTPRNPGCEICPIGEQCGASSAGRQTEYPRPRKRRETIDVVIPVYLVTDSGGRTMLVRPRGGTLLQRMFRLPGDDHEVGAAVPMSGLRRERRIGEIAHTITHRRIRFVVWDAIVDSVAESPEREIRWVARENLDSVPHPSWVRKAMALRRERDVE